MCETKIKNSKAYHSKIDGQIEWTIEDMLRMYVDKRQQLWDKWLCLYEFAYNQRLLSCNLIFALYGQDCKTPMFFWTLTQGLKVSIKWLEKWMKSLNF